MWLMLKLEGAVPEWGLAPSLPLRSQQLGWRNCRARWDLHPSSASPGTG